MLTWVDADQWPPSHTLDTLATGMLEAAGRWTPKRPIARFLPLFSPDSLTLALELLWLLMA